MDDMDSTLDFAIDEINREQDRCDLLEAELEAAEKKVVEQNKELLNLRFWANLESDKINECINSDSIYYLQRAEAAEKRLERYEKLDATGFHQKTHQWVKLEDLASDLGRRAEAAEKRVEEERLIGMKWFDEFTATGAQLDEAKQRVAELEDGLMLLLDGLDSNYDERCGLTNKEWEQRISEARRTLSTLDK